MAKGSPVRDGADATDVTGTPVATDPADVESNVTPAGDEFSSKGSTVLRTRPGSVFYPSGDLPVVTPEGVNVSAEQADTILAQSDATDGRVYRTDTKDGE